MKLSQVNFNEYFSSSSFFYFCCYFCFATNTAYEKREWKLSPFFSLKSSAETGFLSHSLYLLDKQIAKKGKMGD